MLEITYQLKLGWWWSPSFCIEKLRSNMGAIMKKLLTSMSLLHKIEVDIFSLHESYFRSMAGISTSSILWRSDIEVNYFFITAPGCQYLSIPLRKRQLLRNWSWNWPPQPTAVFDWNFSMQQLGVHHHPSLSG